MWKLLYTRLLGYDVDFGHRQAMDLIAGNTYAEKQVGYVACSVLLNEVSLWHLTPNWSDIMRSLHRTGGNHLDPSWPLQKDEFLRLVINSVRNDLLSRNEAFQCLALDFTANGEWQRPSCL